MSPMSPALQVDSLPTEPPGTPEMLSCVIITGHIVLSLYSHVQAKSLQSRPILWEPMDSGMPGSFVHGIQSIE